MAVKFVTHSKYVTHYMVGLHVDRAIDHHPYGWCLDPVGDIEKYEHMVLNHVRNYCYAVTKDHELVHVTNHGGNLPHILRAAKYFGATHLHCYDTGLVQLYEKAGAVVVSRQPFDRSLCPNAPADLSPDYVRMILDDSTDREADYREW